MRKAERNQGLRTLVGRVLPESGRELLAFSVRTAKKIRSFADGRKWAVSWLRTLPTARSVWRTVGRTLDGVHTVALLAEGERESLTRDTKWLGRNGKLIPNGKPSGRSLPHGSEPAPAWADRLHDICVVGRIEPRKRQLEIARAAAAQGQSVVFVGHPSPSSPRYVADFEAIVAADPNLLWVGGVEHEEVLDLMGNSRVLLNGSWVEVQSLVDIEGAAAGCWVVVGRGGNSSEWLGGSVVAVETYDVGQLLLKAADVLRSNVEPTPTDYAHTWEMASEKLSEVYAEL
jgi:glycosyltransferase involved in cell wall biosynthesis